MDLSGLDGYDDREPNEIPMDHLRTTTQMALRGSYIPSDTIVPINDSDYDDLSEAMPQPRKDSAAINPILEHQFSGHGSEPQRVVDLSLPKSPRKGPRFHMPKRGSSPIYDTARRDDQYHAPRTQFGGEFNPHEPTVERWSHADRNVPRSEASSVHRKASSRLKSALHSLNYDTLKNTTSLVREATMKIAHRTADKIRTINRLAAENDMPGWNSTCGTKIIKWTFLRLPIPLLLVLLALSMPAGVAYMYMSDLPQIDVSLSSFTVPEHPQALLSDGAYAAKRACSGDNCLDTVCNAIQSSRNTRGSPLYAESQPASRSRRASSTTFTIALVYRAKGGNILVPEAVKDMHDIESRLAVQSSMDGETSSFNGLTGFFYPPDGQYGSEAELLQQSEINNAVNYAIGSTPQPGYPDPLGSEVLQYGSGFENVGGQWEAEYLRAEFTTYQRPSDATVARYIDILDVASTAYVEVIYASSEIFNYQILEMVESDIYYVIYAVSFVGAYMLFHTSSLFLTIVGIVNICSAFPVGYFIYREVFGHVNLSILAAVSMFVVIGIGVDDVFVFIDMFRQPDRAVQLEERMVHTMKTAARATMFTTLTSAAAFAANTLSEIPALADFGLLTALIIGSNYVLLLLVIPATLCFWWQYIEPTERRIAKCIKCIVISPARPFMSGGDESDSDFEMEHDDEIEKQKGRYRKRGQKHAGGVEEISISPPYVAPPPFDEEDAPIERRTPLSTKHGKDVNASGKIQPNLSLNAKKTKYKGSFCSACLYNVLGSLDVRGRYPIAGIYLVFLILTIQQASLLQPATKPPALVPEDSNLGKVQELSSVFEGWDENGGVISGSDVTVQGQVPIQNDAILSTASPTDTTSPTGAPASSQPSNAPSTREPTPSPTTSEPTTTRPTIAPSTSEPSRSPTTSAPSTSPVIAITNAPQTSNPTSSPVLSPTDGPTETSAPTISTTVITTTTQPVTLPSNDGAANEDISFLFGLESPYVDRSAADQTAFAEDTAAYLPIFDLTFNRGITGNNVVSYISLGESSIETELGEELLEFCEAMVNSSLLFPGQDCSALPISKYGEQWRDCANQGAGKIYLWLAFDLKSQFTSNTGSGVVVDNYDAIQELVSSLKLASPLLSSAEVSSTTIEKSIYEQLAIDGSIWGIIISLLLCFTAVVLFKAHGRIVAIIMTVIVSNVATVVAIFYWIGWTLGGVEAVSLSILVGTCVDYAIHMTEGFLEADPEYTRGLRQQALEDLYRAESDDQKRWWRVRQAISSVGVPICSSAITTAGSAVFLTLCEIQLFKRFGEIIVINTVVSITLTMTMLPALLAIFGPKPFKASFKRSLIALFALLLFFGFIVLVLYIMAEAGSPMRGPTGANVF